MPAEIVELEEALRRFDRLLYDTNILISAWKATVAGTWSPALAKVPRPSRSTSIVAVVEFVRGPTDLSRAEFRSRDEWLLDQSIMRLPFDATASATLNSQLRASREPRRVGDALLAAQAVATRMPILTDNIKDFRAVDHLVIVRAP